jgi:hypothetical protein
MIDSLLFSSGGASAVHFFENRKRHCLKMIDLPQNKS